VYNQLVKLIIIIYKVVNIL